MGRVSVCIYIYITYVYGVWPQQFDLKLFSDSRVAGFTSSCLQIAMSTACAAVAKISDPRFRELLPAPGELRAEEVDAAGAKLREHVELNQCGKLFRVLSNQVELPSLTLSVQEKGYGCPYCRFHRSGCTRCNPDWHEERRPKVAKVRPWSQFTRRNEEMAESLQEGHK